MIFTDFEEARKEAKKFGEIAADNVGITIQLDESIFAECFESGSASCEFHGDGPVNHIKQASHLAFWIIKLKPSIKGTNFRDHFAKLFGIKENVLALLEKDHVDSIKRAENFYINEYIATILAHHLIEKGYDDIKDQLEINKNMEDLNELKVLLAANESRLARSSIDLVLSYREHNYSARAMATMYNLAFSTGYESIKRGP